MSIRYIELENEKLKDLVVKKGEIVDKGRKHYQKMEKLHEEGNAIGEERNTIVAEIIKLTAEELKGVEMSEFEVASSSEIKNGKLRVSVIDRLAQAKERMRAEKDKEQRKEEGELTEAEVIEETQAKVLKAVASIPKEELSEKLEQILKVLN